MSDFTHDAWSIYIAVITLVSIAACAVLLFSLSSRRTGEPYVTHPLAVAGILADLRLDATAIIAGLSWPSISTANSLVCCHWPGRFSTASMWPRWR